MKWNEMKDIYYKWKKAYSAIKWEEEEEEIVKIWASEW